MEKRSGLTLQRSQAYRLGTAVLPTEDNAEMYSAQDEGPVRCFGSLLAKRISTKVSTACGYFCGCTLYYKKESAGRLIPFYNIMCSRKSIHRLWILLLISALQAKNRNSAQDLRPVRCTFQHYLPWAIPPSRGGTLGNVGASDPTVFPKEKRFKAIPHN